MDGLNQLLESLGLAMLGVAAGLIVYRAWFLSSARTAEGEVVDLAEHSPGWSDGEQPHFRPVFAAVVMFRDERGHRYKFESGIHARPGRRFHGETVRVVYDPSNPQHAFIGEFFELWAMPGVLILVGCGLLWRHFAPLFT